MTVLEGAERWLNRVRAHVDRTVDPGLDWQRERASRLLVAAVKKRDRAVGLPARNASGARGRARVRS